MRQTNARVILVYPTPCLSADFKWQDLPTSRVKWQTMHFSECVSADGYLHKLGESESMRRYLYYALRRIEWPSCASVGRRIERTECLPSRRQPFQARTSAEFYLPL